MIFALMNEPLPGVTKLDQSSDRGAVIAGAQIVDAIGSKESLPFVGVSIRKWIDDDRVRQYLEFVISKIESGELQGAAEPLIFNTRGKNNHG
ncbi:MAG TPA: hypothetical protein VEV42_12100 [Pyrinomonadaceae bacterium]|nr:hypothetical protein [Pyrinomonadaceae bacterium]